jgi:hypothetical protein
MAQTPIQLKKEKDRYILRQSQKQGHVLLLCSQRMIIIWLKSSPAVLAEPPLGLYCNSYLPAFITLPSLPSQT